MPFLNQRISVTASQPMAQLVKIGNSDLTRNSPEKQWRGILEFTKFGGIGIKLNPAQLNELLTEARNFSNQDECIKDILEALEEALEQDLSEPDSVDSKDDDNSAVDKKDIEAIAAQFDPRLIRANRIEAIKIFAWDRYPNSINGYKKLGVHETKKENVTGLTARGPEEAFIDTGNGSGKGPGFYLTPIGFRSIFAVLAPEAAPINYGESFTVVYIKEDIREVRVSDPGQDNTNILEPNHGEYDCYYVMSGGQEIVIPPRCFKHVKVLANHSQLKQLEQSNQSCQD